MSFMNRFSRLEYVDNDAVVYVGKPKAEPFIRTFNTVSTTGNA